MDRDLGKPKTSRSSTETCTTTAYRRAGSGRIHLQYPRRFSDLPMKQINDLVQPATSAAVSSKAHDNDATFNKEFYR